MKKLFEILTLAALAVFSVSCNTTDEPQEKAQINVQEGNVFLEDKEFGMYYGNLGYDGYGVYSVVLSNAVCFRDGYGAPYLDSEGDMIVLEFKAPIEQQLSDAPIMIPVGKYDIDPTKSEGFRINVAKSYVKRLVGNTQYRYELLSGSVIVGRNTEGGYDIMTEDLIIARGKEQIPAQYSYNGNLLFDDWKNIAATLQTIKDDIIDIPFTDVSAVYYGNLFEMGTGNYVIGLSTAGFMEDQTGKVPGVALIMNMFSKLADNKDDDVILLKEGTYTVYPSINCNEFSMLYGFDMSGVPFGTYLAQVDRDLAQSLEYISTGTVKVTRESRNYNDVYTLQYDLVTPTRKVQGTWVGPIEFDNQAQDSGRVILSTLDDDVECDMHRVEEAHLNYIETLKTTPLPSVDIAEAWQLWLEPRMWTEEEKQIENWEDRINTWDPNGDVMILEFVIPFEPRGNIAPEINKEYSYQVQPNLTMDDVLYGQSISKMGRPYDDIFYEPNWGTYKYMTGVDTRRGFTWDGGYRGNWYLHYQEGTWQNMDEMAPAVKGTVKVTRLTEYVMAGVGCQKAEFKFVWDLYDDAEASYNITGEWSGPVNVHISGDI
ncbi:MAG: hypothetical protein IKV05_07210 [Bacteroidales bacterium]|nr:hypothetical protein [Bacteroidales bacterium]